MVGTDVRTFNVIPIDRKNNRHAVFKSVLITLTITIVRESYWSLMKTLKQYVLRRASSVFGRFPNDVRTFAFLMNGATDLFSSVTQPLTF